jgi:hypothetical protein
MVLFFSYLSFGGPYAKSKINIGKELAADHGPPKKKEKEKKRTIKDYGSAASSFPIFILDFAYLAITSLRFLLRAESVSVAGLPRFVFVLDDMLYYCALADIRSSLRLYGYGRVRNRFFVIDKNSRTLVSSKKSLMFDIKSYNV